MCFYHITVYGGDMLFQHAPTGALHMVDRPLVPCYHSEVTVERCPKAPPPPSFFSRLFGKTKSSRTLEGKMVCEDVRQTVTKVRSFCGNCAARLDDDPFALTKLGEENKITQPSAAYLIWHDSSLPSMYDARPTSTRSESYTREAAFRNQSKRRRGRTPYEANTL